jgi:two-component system sensor histidine kinase UhpB
VEENFVFLTICFFLLIVFVVSLYQAAKGNSALKHFLWAWAILMLLVIPFTSRANTIPSIAAGLLLMYFLYVIFVANKESVQKLERSHEETRMVLAESNRRIEEERRALSRRLHDDINPNLLLCRNELRRIESSFIGGDENTAKSLNSAISLVGDAYTKIRDIIKNTRIEVIDSIGFTAALESLVAHYTDFFDKPEIVLEHNLPPRPELSENLSVTAYKVIREAIYNAIKHSGAKQVLVTIEYNEQRNVYKVAIIDDGVGIKTRQQQQSDPSAGIGLIDMRERVRVIGGELKIQPADAENEKRPGTRVSFSFSGQLS